MPRRMEDKEDAKFSNLSTTYQSSSQRESPPAATSRAKARSSRLARQLWRSEVANSTANTKSGPLSNPKAGKRHHLCQRTEFLP